VDGLVFDSSTTTGAFRAGGRAGPADFLAAFAGTSNPMDGLVQLSPEWLVKNTPELTGLTFVMLAPNCMSMCVTAAIESVGRGMGHVVLAVKLAQHPRPVRSARGEPAGRRVRAGQVRAFAGRSPDLQHRNSSSGTCISTARPTT
jgi:hypothetical protein